ncbi:P22 phage major capsid protein family protein [Pseudomonas sp. CCC3.2]|uniref:P22 phage major capsid protein family protein n=1 Tax=unclassified Pseudomonas TaxID=196821 RepID=UPI002AB4D263|nr:MULTISPECIES: P22 phage major capsid protein family protein [unclassified Pseudomonas]MDY7559954.1 P22 phage major capsid protein family protein [Pseudomonas sp. AB6]MEA9994546.1 P22 phage major capsid protein family protein [Pseudomonas sp. AA4]MEB0085691.1 P22 phage major capsid protein family protein [Pseudomonas sp. RTI1]MEB0125984.1 P22 phage major capsid protein family protein [Pseudomonas sp. CCC1.2]MEB0152788.1 P22 phage major capsid protein family protein [Pseudomonas sp. CCC4.3]
MSNVLTQVATPLLAQGLVALRSMNVMPRLVNSDYQGAAQEKNSVINVPVPSAITVQQVVPGATPPVTADMSPTSVPITLDQWFEAPFYITDQEAMNVMKGTVPMQATEAIKSIANNVNAYILNLGTSFFSMSGTPGTTPFASDTTAASVARKLLNKQLAPTGDRRIVLDMDSEGNAIILPMFQQAQMAGNNTTLVEGVIGRKVGFDWYADQQVPTFVSTPLTVGACTANGVNNAGSKLVSIAKATNASPLVKGDIISFAGSAQTYVVTAANTLSVGNTNVSIYPGLVLATAGGETVTLKASHVLNLAFHRDAIAFATRPLQEVIHPAVISVSQVDPVSGLSLRLEITRQHKQTRYSFDILYGGACVRPELGTRIAG